MKNKMSLSVNMMIEKALEKDQVNSRDRHYLGMSYIGGKCERAIWYSWRNYRKNKFNGFVLKRFSEGHDLEPRIVNWLTIAGFEVRDKNPMARNPDKQFRSDYLGGLISGGVDGFLKNEDYFYDDDWRLLEIKMMASSKYIRDGENVHTGNKYRGSIGTYEHENDPLYVSHVEKKKGQFEGRYWKTLRRGCEKEQQSHYAQMQGYMGLSHEIDENGKAGFQKWGLEKPLTEALYLICNLDISQIGVERIFYRKNWWNRIKLRAEKIARFRNPPPRLNESPTSWDCLYCDFNPVCHGTEVASESCMSCSNMSVKIPGDMNYYGKRTSYICEKRKGRIDDFKTCDQYDLIREITNDF